MTSFLSLIIPTFVLALAITAAPSLSLAKEGGGSVGHVGGGGNGVGGTLLDLYESGNSVELNGSDIFGFLSVDSDKQFDAIPELEMWADFMLNETSTRKFWFLDNRPFASFCVNQSLLDLKDRKILACQNDVEVRINQTWWENASDSDRAKLIMHELVTALAIQIGNLTSVKLATSALYAKEFNSLDFRFKWTSLGFPSVASKEQFDFTRSFYEQSSRELCALDPSARAEAAAQKMIAYSEQIPESSLTPTATRNMFVIALQASATAGKDVETCINGMKVLREMNFRRGWRLGNPQYFRH